MFKQDQVMMYKVYIASIYLQSNCTVDREEMRLHIMIALSLYIPRLFLKKN